MAERKKKSLFVTLTDESTNWNPSWKYKTCYIHAHDTCAYLPKMRWKEIFNQNQQHIQFTNANKHQSHEMIKWENERVNEKQAHTHTHITVGNSSSRDRKTENHTHGIGTTTWNKRVIWMGHRVRFWYGLVLRIDFE